MGIEMAFYTLELIPFLIIWIGVCALTVVLSRRLGILQNKLDAIMRILIEIKNR